MNKHTWLDRNVHWLLLIGFAIGFGATLAKGELIGAAIAQSNPVVQQGPGGRYGTWTVASGAPAVAKATFTTGGVVSVANTATAVLASNTARIGGQIQNQGTQVVFCDDNASLTTSDYAFALKAASAANGGDGGAATLQNGYTGPIYCIVASSTANVARSDF